jgi:hypothetical protein
MPRAERSRARLVAYALAAVIAALAVIPAYLLVPVGWRGLVVRLACALAVIAGCVKIVGSVRRSLPGEPASPLDAPPASPPRPAQDERFVRARDDVVFSTRSRGYFDTILWPRLRKLGAAGPPPSERRWPGRRGPSLRTLERVITGIEERG